MSSLFGDLDLETAADDPFAIPDNTYLAYLTNVKVGPTKAGDKVGITFTYTISSGVHKDKEVTEWKNIPRPANPKNPSAEDQRAMSFLKARLLSLGVPGSKVNDVEPDDLIGTHCVITVRNKNGYTNVGNVKVVPDGFDDEPAHSEPDDGTPF